MKKIIIFLVILIATILFTSCSTQQRVVYRDCDCNTTTFGFGWNNNPFWGLNDPLWGWNSWNWHPYRVIPRYYIYPNRVQPHQPTRYERRTSIGNRPSRNTQNQSNYVDPMYPKRTPSIPSINAEPSQRTTQPSRIQSNPNRNYQPQQRNTQSPSRNAQPAHRNTTPTNRSRVGNEPVSNLTPKWYAPQQSTTGTNTPMVTPQIIFQGENGRGYSGPGSFGNN